VQLLVVVTIFAGDLGLLALGMEKVHAAAIRAKDNHAQVSTASSQRVR
jgi:hypothetical protein